MMMYSNDPSMPLKSRFRVFSRSGLCSISTSNPISSTLEGMTFKVAMTLSTMRFSTDSSPINPWYRVFPMALLSMPRPVVALAWGSQSTSNVSFPAVARAAARLTAVVVLPTPPFWLAIQKIRLITNIFSLKKEWSTYSVSIINLSDIHEKIFLNMDIMQKQQLQGL